jgi:hypothetical protein
MCQFGCNCDVGCYMQHCGVQRITSLTHLISDRLLRAGRGLVHWTRSSVVAAVPAPAAAGRPAMQCRQSRAVHAGQACALPQRHSRYLHRCHSSANPVRLHAHEQHHTSGSMHGGGNGGGGSSRRLRRDAAATVTEVRLHSAENAGDVDHLADLRDLLAGHWTSLQIHQTRAC